MGDVPGDPEVGSCAKWSLEATLSSIEQEIEAAAAAATSSPSGGVVDKVESCALAAVAVGGEGRQGLGCGGR